MIKLLLPNFNYAIFIAQILLRKFTNKKRVVGSTVNQHIAKDAKIA
jgi:hypothetical protein